MPKATPMACSVEIGVGGGRGSTLGSSSSRSFLAFGRRWGADLGEIAETGFMPVLLAALRVMRRVEKSEAGSTSVMERRERVDRKSVV